MLAELAYAVIVFGVLTAAWWALIDKPSKLRLVLFGLAAVIAARLAE